MITGHGDDRYRFDRTIRADFSSNVWFGGPPPELINHLERNLHLIGSYPEPDAGELCRIIAAHQGVDPRQVLVFNGSVEAFYTVALAFRGSASSVLSPSFAEYEDACRVHGHRLCFFKGDDFDATLKSGTEMVWLGNPNNPDGRIFSVMQVEKALRNNPDTLLVVDEAYAGLVSGFQSVIALTRRYANLVVVRSLTKSCVIPGLRLGYIVTTERVAERIRRYQMPWSVNALAQEAGNYLIGRMGEGDVDCHRIGKLSRDLQLLIGMVDGFRVVPSETPFFLVEMQSGSAAGLKDYLIREHGLLIRDASNFRGLNERYFRVCTRDENENRLLVEGLKAYSTITGPGECRVSLVSDLFSI